MSNGSVYKRCGCRDPRTGRSIGRTCRRLRRRNGSWNPDHGTWHYFFELPQDRAGRRRRLRRGGFTSSHEVEEELDRIRALLAIPEPDDDHAVAQVVDLILAATKKGHLPTESDVRRKLTAGHSLQENITVAEWLDDWLHTKKRIRRSTKTSYASHIRIYFKPYLGHIRLGKLRVSHVADMFDAIDERNDLIQQARATKDPKLRAQLRYQRVVGPASKQRIRCTLRAALNAAIRQQLITINPAALVELPSGKRPKPLVWTDERVTRWQTTGEVPSKVMVWTPQHTGRFLDHITSDPLYALYHLIAYRGLRRGEACGLRWADIDWTSHSLTVRWQLVVVNWEAHGGAPKSEAGDRTVALDADTITVLKHHRSLQNRDRLAAGQAWTDTGLVFTQPDGTPHHPETISNHFRDLTHNAELPPIRLHDLRHGAATMMLAAGIDMKVVQETLGHSNYAFTADTYTSVLPELAQAAATAIANLVPRTRRPDLTDRSNHH